MSFLWMALPATGLAAYGVLLSISSGFIPSSVVAPAVPLAAVAAVILSALRWAFLRSGERGPAGDALDRVS